MARRKEILVTVVTNLLLQICTAICGFVLPPLIISTFGSSVNGMISSITQFIAYLNLVEAGIGGASIAALYRPLAENNISERNSILSATRAFYNKSGYVFTLLIILLSFIYPLLVGEEVDRFTASLMIPVLGITGVAEFFLIGKYRVLLAADRKVYIISIIQMVAVVLNTLLAYILIKIGLSIIIVKLSTSLVYLSRYLLISLYVNDKYRDLSFKSEKNRTALNQNRNVLVHQLSGLIVFNSPIILITIFCSLKDVSVYAVYALVFSGVTNLLGSFSNGMQSFFGETMVRGDINITRNMYKKFEIMYFSVLGLFYCLSNLLLIPFMELYTRRMNDANYIQRELGYLFVIVGILNNMRNPGAQIINGAGHFRKTQTRAIAEASINILTSLFFVKAFGFKGVLLGAICSGLYRSIDVLLYVNKHILYQKCYGSVIRFLGCMGLYAVISIVVAKASTIIAETYIQWFIYAIVYTGLLSVPIIIIIFSNLSNSNNTGFYFRKVGASGNRVEKTKI